MLWNRSEVIALSSLKCACCSGAGLTTTGAVDAPCDCVTRSIFRACFNRFKDCVRKDKGASTVKLERLGMGTGRSSHMSYGRKTEEYIADFYLLCQRTLTEAEWGIFRFHYLLGADASLMTRRCHMTRAAFETMTRAMEAKLGRVFRETEPFALYPLDEYFSVNVRGAAIAPTMPLDTRTRPRLCPPLRPAIAEAA